MYTGILRCVVCGKAGVVLKDDEEEMYCKDHVTWSNVDKDTLLERLEEALKIAKEERRNLEEAVKRKEILDFTYHEDDFLKRIIDEVNEWFKE